MAFQTSAGTGTNNGRFVQKRLVQPFRLAVSGQTALWQPAYNTLSADWSVPAHWSTTTVPGASDSVEIGPGVTNTATFTVTATNEAAAALLLAQAAGTLALTGTLAVGGALTLEAGTLVVGSGTLVSGTLLEEASTLGTADLTAGSGASLTIGGDVIQSQAGDTLALAGATLMAAGMTLQGLATLSAGADAAIGGQLVLGVEATTLDPSIVSGPGTLDLAGSSTLTAATLDLLANSALAIDATSAVALDGARATAGALTVPTGSTLHAPSGTIDGNLVLDGLLRATFSYAGYADPGSELDITGTLGGSGSLDVPGALGTPGTVEIGNAAGFTGSVTLDPGTELVLDTGVLAKASVQFLGATIDLRGQSFGSGLTPGYDATTGLLTVGGSTLDVGTGFSAGQFAVTADPFGGTNVLMPEPACYVAGTRILCDVGERPVELLRPGDRVVTVSGRLAPVRWVGWTTIDLARHPAPQHAAPVRIRADAVAPGLPRRDLRVSPDHALLLAGRLIPARLLCNGATILSEQGLDRIGYVHVELDRHDILLAEGLPAESYLDTGNRGLFAGEAGTRALHPELAAEPELAARRAYAERGYAPLARRATALHARLRRRAEALGWRLTTWPDLLVIADTPGTAATPFGPDGLHLFLPPGGREIRITSRSFIPDQLDPCAGDGRRLGVALAVRLAGKPLAAHAYRSGWYPPQPACRWRWTDGDACIVLAPRPCEVKLTIKLMAANARYWLAPETEASANRAA